MCRKKEPVLILHGKNSRVGIGTHTHHSPKCNTLATRVTLAQIQRYEDRNTVAYTPMPHRQLNHEPPPVRKKGPSLGLQKLLHSPNLARSNHPPPPHDGWPRSYQCLPFKCFTSLLSSLSTVLVGSLIFNPLSIKRLNSIRFTSCPGCSVVPAGQKVSSGS